MKKLILLLLVICTACSIDEQDTVDPVFCTTDIVAGLDITVVDATDMESFLTSGIIVVVQDGDYRETLTNFPDSNSFIGAFERTGTYTITVSGDGYETFMSDMPITVDSDICHVITERREIMLVSN